MSNTKMENKLITREIIIANLSGKYTLTMPTLIKHVSVPSDEPFIWRSTNVVPKKKKEHNDSEADTLVSDGPDGAFDPHRL